MLKKDIKSSEDIFKAFWELLWSREIGHQCEAYLVFWARLENILLNSS